MTRREHDQLHHVDSGPERSITSGYSAMNVEMADRHWREDNLAGWANDPRPLYLRVAEMLMANLLVFAACAVVLVVVTKLFLD